MAVLTLAFSQIVEPASIVSIAANSAADELRPVSYARSLAHSAQKTMTYETIMHALIYFSSNVHMPKHAFTARG